MCGVAGFLGWEPNPAWKEVARQMASTLAHRGPDHTNAYVDPSHRCALGHTRLRIIDLETGDQPMGSEDGMVQAVFNGEIYNFQDLRSQLVALGHHFRTRSDTEVLVHGWEEWGRELPKRLDGMFAFAIWDGNHETLFLARDRFGKKPLFLRKTPHGLAFASEIKALAWAPGEPLEPDPSVLPLYLAYGYVPTPGTFYQGVAKLPPASWQLVTRDGRQEEGVYWQADYTTQDMGEGEAADQVRILLEAAVRRRLVADVPLGAFLSGGLDSSLIVGLMAHLSDQPVRTFSIGFTDDPTYDETSYARTVAQHFGTEHTEFVVDAQSLELIDRLVEGYDEPFGDSSAIPTYLVSQLTRQEVTVALTGDGGDEVFAGYDRFRGALLAETMPRWMSAWGNALGRRLPYNPNFRSFSRRFSRFFQAAALPLDERMLRWIGFFPHPHQTLLRDDFPYTHSRGDLLRSFREPLTAQPGVPVLGRVLQMNMQTYLLDDLLVKADRCSMAHGLELRSPFLDTALVEFANSLPPRLLLRPRATKLLLRKAYADFLPQEILSRRKMGFGIPLPTWFRTHWRGALEERLLPSQARIYQWLQRGPVEAMVKRHLTGESDEGHQLWALLTLETWLQREPWRVSSQRAVR